MIARLLDRLRPEVIGVPECPLLHRWTIFNGSSVKLLLHHFLPESRDRDPHDHPRPFWTFVLAGEYTDEEVIGEGPRSYERMRAGTLRFRPARHLHRTFSEHGAWTLVLMGPKERPWGFRREGRWWPFREYEEKYGLGMRCE